jgi:hypothetical protein
MTSAITMTDVRKFVADKKCQKYKMKFVVNVLNYNHDEYDGDCSKRNYYDDYLRRRDCRRFNTVGAYIEGAIKDPTLIKKMKNDFNKLYEKDGNVLGVYYHPPNSYNRPRDICIVLPKNHRKKMILQVIPPYKPLTIKRKQEIAWGCKFD